jgi:hypothetical protein
MITATYNGWSIRYSGGAYADIYCPHNRPVEVVNYWDYYKGTSANPAVENLHRDLTTMVDEATEGEWIGHYCIGHAQVRRTQPV